MAASLEDLLLFKVGPAYVEEVAKATGLREGSIIIVSSCHATSSAQIITAFGPKKLRCIPSVIVLAQHDLHPLKQTSWAERRQAAHILFSTLNFSTKRFLRLVNRDRLDILSFSSTSRAPLRVIGAHLIHSSPFSSSFSCEMFLYTCVCRSRKYFLWTSDQLPRGGLAIPSGSLEYSAISLLMVKATLLPRSWWSEKKDITTIHRLSWIELDQVFASVCIVDSLNFGAAENWRVKIWVPWETRLRQNRTLNAHSGSKEGGYRICGLERRERVPPFWSAQIGEPLHQFS